MRLTGDTSRRFLRPLPRSDASVNGGSSRKGYQTDSQRLRQGQVYGQERESTAIRRNHVWRLCEYLLLTRPVSRDSLLDNTRRNVNTQPKSER